MCRCYYSITYIWIKICTHFPRVILRKIILISSIYDGSLGVHESDADDVLQWVTIIAMEDNIEHISEQMLDRLLQDHKVC